MYGFDGSVNGDWVYYVNSEDYPYNFGFTSTLSSAAVFSLDASGHLLFNDFAAGIPSGYAGTSIGLNEDFNSYPDDLACDLTDESFTCEAHGLTLFYVLIGPTELLGLQLANDGFGGHEVTLQGSGVYYS